MTETPRFAFCATSAPDPTAAAEEVIRKSLTVRQTERLAQKLLQGPRPQTRKAPPDTDTAALEADLAALGMRSVGEDERRAALGVGTPADHAGGAVLRRQLDRLRARERRWQRDGEQARDHLRGAPSSGAAGLAGSCAVLENVRESVCWSWVNSGLNRRKSGSRPRCSGLPASQSYEGVE